VKHKKVFFFLVANVIVAFTLGDECASLLFWSACRGEKDEESFFSSFFPFPVA
jgi:hypothetical protein